MPREKKSKITQINSESEQKIAELTASLQRALADFANLKRQTELDQIKISKRIKSDLILEILPVLDNFQLAAKHIPAELENNNWAQGVKQIEKQFESILTSNGLEKIPTVGVDFNHYSHEAVESVDSDKPENEIIEEIQSGYCLGDTVIRPAKVKVSSGKQN